MYTAGVQQRARVTAADIARLAGVGRAAVSNWRKRYDSFPAPIGGTPASPQFDLDQVGAWLAEQGKLPAVSDEDRVWRGLLAAAGDPATALAAAGEHLGGDRPLPYEALRPDLTALAAKRGTRAIFAELWQRFADLPAQRATATPGALADLMVTLARVGGGTVFDPACGTGRLLRAAADHGARAGYGQDNDPAAARLAELWMVIHDLSGSIHTGDSLRHDGFDGRTFDAVVANLPFGLTNWGHEELGFDRRWEFGVPPRTEPELAWVQHALAHLAPGGRAVLLMPPSAASRRAGRRIRAELLRRGAVHAIIALPTGAAAPHAIGLHLWILHRPTGTSAASVLLVDATTADIEGGAAQIVQAVKTGGGIAHAVPVIDLLDDEVDLTPGRRGPEAASGADSVVAVRASRDRLAGIAAEITTLLPDLTAEPDPAGALPTVGVSDLVRAGHVQVFGPVRAGSTAIPLLPGDVVVPVNARNLTARVVGDQTAALGRGLQLLRCDPQALDPWFLAGHLRTSANERQSGGSSATLRFDVRRAQVPRIPLAEQARHGAVFRRLQQLDDAIQAAAVLSGELTRHCAEGLASGRSRPKPENV